MPGPTAAEGGRPFVEPGSIVRTIWGNGDLILLIFGGAAAEFALNRAVDWLFFTGRLPSDPIGRLFTTAAYAQGIVFAREAEAAATLARIRAVHGAVERQRGRRIPAWAQRDVLYMLIDYTERAHELVQRPLTPAEREGVYGVFRRVGTGLGIPELPIDHGAWRVDRELHLRRDLVRSAATDALYAAYREHLGAWRYELLLRLQSILVPERVRALLGLGDGDAFRPLGRLYPAVVRARMRPVLRRMLVPGRYRTAVGGLDWRTT